MGDVAATLAELRSRGWAVAVHNDYRLHGRTHTFWLFTNGDLCARGEATTDDHALAIVQREVSRIEAARRPETEDERRDRLHGRAAAWIDTVEVERDPIGSSNDPRWNVRFLGAVVSGGFRHESYAFEHAEQLRRGLNEMGSDELIAELRLLRAVYDAARTFLWNDGDKCALESAVSKAEERNA